MKNIALEKNLKGLDDKENLLKYESELRNSSQKCKQFILTFKE